MELNQFYPPTSSDDLCLLSCLDSSSMPLAWFQDAETLNQNNNQRLLAITVIQATSHHNHTAYAYSISKLRLLFLSKSLQSEILLRRMLRSPIWDVNDLKIAAQKKF